VVAGHQRLAVEVVTGVLLSAGEAVYLGSSLADFKKFV